MFTLVANALVFVFYRGDSPSTRRGFWRTAPSVSQIQEDRGCLDLGHDGNGSVVFMVDQKGHAYYEYLWSRFALRNLGTISFGGWFWTSLGIAVPLSELRKGVRNGSVGRDVGLNISGWGFDGYAIRLLMACS